MKYLMIPVIALTLSACVVGNDDPCDRDNPNYDARACQAGNGPNEGGDSGGDAGGNDSGK